MATQRSSPGEAGRLDILNISVAEECAYRWLLARPGANVTEIAQGLGMGNSKAQRLLDTIAAKGLATHTPDRPRRYLPVSPDIAIEALLQRRQDELDRARRLVPELQKLTANLQIDMSR